MRYNAYGDPVFSHEVKATEVELHYTQQDSRVTVHKAGCQHAADEKRPFDLSEVQDDDYYNVAPCARRR